MRDRDYIFPLMILPVGAAFIIACFLVWLSAGKNRGFIAAKMRIGAFLLSFSYFASCERQPPVMCYDPGIPPDHIAISDADMNYHAGDTVHGSVMNMTYHYFSFDISDSAGSQTVQSGSLVPADGAFDATTENFLFVLDTSLDAGAFRMKIYGEDNSQINQTALLFESAMHIE